MQTEELQQQKTQKIFDGQEHKEKEQYLTDDKTSNGDHLKEPEYQWDIKSSALRRLQQQACC